MKIDDVLRHEVVRIGWRQRRIWRVASAHEIGGELGSAEVGYVLMAAAVEADRRNAAAGNGGGGLATNSEKRELQRRQWGQQMEEQSRFRREQAESTRQLRDHTTVGPGPGYGGIPDIAREPYETRIDLIGGRSPFDRS